MSQFSLLEEKIVLSLLGLDRYLILDQQARAQVTSPAGLAAANQTCSQHAVTLTFRYI